MIVTAVHGHHPPWREITPYFEINCSIFRYYTLIEAPKVLLYYFLASTLYIQCHVSIFHWIKLLYTTKMAILYFTSLHWTSIVPTLRETDVAPDNTYRIIVIYFRAKMYCYSRTCIKIAIMKTNANVWWWLWVYVNLKYIFPNYLVKYHETSHYNILNKLF